MGWIRQGIETIQGNFFYMQLLNLVVNLLAALIWFLLGYFWRRILSFSLARWQFTRLFGSKSVIEGENVFVVLDVYSDSRPAIVDGKPQARYFKEFPYRGKVRLIGPHEIMGSCSARGAGYLSSAFAKYREEPVQVVSDVQVADRWDATLICMGSSDSNIKSREILELEENEYCDFVFTDDGTRAIKKQGAEGLFVMSPNTPRDYGLIVRLPNNSYPGHSLIVCAGLGEWGTSGAAFYLSQNWRRLSKEYSNRAFGIVVEVIPGSDESAREVSEPPPQVGTVTEGAGTIAWDEVWSTGSVQIAKWSNLTDNPNHEKRD